MGFKLTAAGAVWVWVDVVAVAVVAAVVKAIGFIGDVAIGVVPIGWFYKCWSCWR